jgi:glycosyltransferase involved in cell wall biosynthesis
MSPLRIAVVKPDWGIRGGFELVLDRIIEHVEGAGHRIDLLQFDAWRSDRRPFGVDTPPEAVAEMPQFHAYMTQLETCRQLDVGRADVVISTQPPSFAVHHPRHLSIFFHHQRVFYDLAEPALAAGLVPRRHHEATCAAVRAIDDDALSRVSYVLAGSETVQQRLRDFNRRTERVGVFHAGPSIGLGQSPTSSPGPRPIALCVSRHDFPKRTELFVHAMHLAPEVDAVSVGAGGRLGFLRRLDLDWAENGAPDVIPDSETWLNDPIWTDPSQVPPSSSNVQFRTGIGDDELRSLFERSFCLVAPALDEDYGLTAIEAMRLGLPVITCRDSGHLTWFVDDGVTGLVVEPTGLAIRDAVRTLRDDPERAVEMGAEGRRRAAELTWERALRQFDAGLAEVLG